MADDAPLKGRTPLKKSTLLIFAILFATFGSFFLYKSYAATDTTPPTTSITSPINGAKVSGNVNIAANAADNVGVTNVQFYAGTTLLGIDTSASSPYGFTWDSTTVLDGNYPLKTIACDAANNCTTSAIVTVTVNNTAPAVPGDVTGDGHVTLQDLSILLTNYGMSGATLGQGDVDGNGTINLADLSILLTNYGK